jgi:hypothetical protein
MSAQITLNDMVQCAGREVGLRRQVYPSMVARGKLSQAKADEQIEVMEAIYRYLKHDLETVLGKAAKNEHV